MNNRLLSPNRKEDESAWKRFNYYDRGDQKTKVKERLFIESQNIMEQMLKKRTDKTYTSWKVPEIEQQGRIFNMESRFYNAYDK